MYLIFVPSQIVLHHLDMIKDFLLLTRMMISLGGILVILEHYYIFSSSVSLFSLRSQPKEIRTFEKLPPKILLLPKTWQIQERNNFI